MIRLYDLTDGGAPAGELPHEAGGMILVLAFSPDGTRLASAGGLDRFVQVHDVKDRTVLLAEEAPYSVGGLAWAPDGESLYLGCVDALMRWSLAEKDVVDGMGGHEESTRGLAVDAKGEVVYFGDGGGAVRGWNLAAGEQVFFTAEHRDSVVSTALSPDGKTLLSGSHDGTVRFWDVATQREILVAPGHTNLVQAIAWSADGTTLATGCYDNSVCLWAGRSGKMLHHLIAHEYAVIGVAFLDDLCVSAAGDNVLRFWNPDGTEARRIELGDRVSSLSGFAAHGARGATGHWQGEMFLLDLASGEVIVNIEGHQGPVTTLAYSPSGAKLATGGWDGKLRVFTADGELRFADDEGTEMGLSQVLFLDEDTVLVVDGEGHVGARAAKDGAERWSFDLGEDGWVGAIALTHDGSTLALASSDGLCLHSASDGARELVVPTPDGAIGGMAFRPDGKALATGMEDSTVLLWRLAKLREKRR